MVRPLVFDGSTFWTVFHRKIEAVADDNGLAAREKPTHVLVILQG
jgi:hypothetical protein